MFISISILLSIVSTIKPFHLLNVCPLRFLLPCWPTDFIVSHSFRMGLRDRSIEVVQPQSKDSRKITTSVPPACDPITKNMDSIWEDIASLPSGRFWSMANFEKAFAHCNLAMDSTTHHISSFLTAPKLSTVLANVRTWGKSPRTNWITTPITGTRNQPMLCFPPRSSFSRLKSSSTRWRPTLPCLLSKSRLQEIAVLANSAAINLRSSVHEALDKAVNARLSAHRDAINHLSLDLRPVRSILTSSPLMLLEM